MRPGSGLRRYTPLSPSAIQQGQSRLARRSPIGRDGEPAGAASPRRTARYTGPDKKTRELVLERDGRCCVCCGRSVIGQPYSLQHRKRRSQGGTNDPSNLLTVLGLGGQMCHGRMDARTDPHDEGKGYALFSWQDPAAEPVMVFTSPDGSGVTYWLTDDGERVTEQPREEAAA